MLDVEDALLGRIAEILFDPATGQLDPLLDAQLEPLGSRLLILETAQLTPEWRGFGLGVLLAGTAIKKLSGGVRFAVCDPAPRPDPGTTARPRRRPRPSRPRWPCSCRRP